MFLEATVGPSFNMKRWGLDKPRAPISTPSATSLISAGIRISARRAPASAC